MGIQAIQNRAGTTTPPLSRPARFDGVAATFKWTSVLRRCDGAPTMHAISENAASRQSLAAPSIALPYVAAVVERWESRTNRAEVELKRQVQDRRLNSITCKTIDTIEE